MVAGATEPLKWSHGLGGSDGVWDPLFQPTDDTWVQREFNSMLREVRVNANPAGADKSESELSKECIAFRQDVFADVGTVLAAGCKPTTDQMSRLMDNPLGSVAMWINQLDVIPLTNDAIDPDHSEIYTNYMGIFQFPKGITKNWNVISRIVYNIPSVPLDQDASPPTGASRRRAPRRGSLRVSTPTRSSLPST